MKLTPAQLEQFHTEGWLFLPELFTPEEFDINRPWEHFKQKTLDETARAKIDRGQFGLEQTQEKR